MNMTNVKSTIKKHAFEISCGGAAVVVLAVCYFGIPFVWGGFPAVSAELSEEAHKRVANKVGITAITNETPNLEGVNYGKIDPKQITFTDSLAKLREKANDQMQVTKAKVLREAAANNRARRVNVANEGTDRQQYFALFWDEDLELTLKLPSTQRLLKSKGFQAASQTFPFVKIYQDAFVKMTKELTGSQDINAGIVPEFADLEAAYKEEKKRMDDAEPGAFRRPGVPTAAPPIDLAARDAYIKNAVMAVANRTAMYVDPHTAYQIRPMGGGTAPPTPTDIWEGYVDVWLQRDVIEAIAKTNKESNNKGEGVAKSLIPHLLNIRVGPGAKALFPPTATVSPMAGSGGPTGGPVATPSTPAENRGPTGIIFEKMPQKDEKLENLESMTGRVGDDQYYVVMMSVSFVCEPSAVNKFINNLYERNGYTVINERHTTVDPYNSGGQGFLYGNRQCVQVDLLVECLMFRSWVDAVIPDPYP